MIIADPPDFDNEDGTTKTIPIARQIYDPAFIIPLPAPTPSSTTTTFITIFTTTTIIFPSQQPSSQPTTITFPSQQPSSQPTTITFSSQQPSSQPTTIAFPSQQPSSQPTTHFSKSFTPLPPSKAPPPLATTSQATVSFPQHKHPSFLKPSTPTPQQPSHPTSIPTSSPTSGTPAQITSSPTSGIPIQTTSLPTPVPTSSPSPLVPTTTPTSSLPPATADPILNATRDFGSAHLTHNSQKSSTPSPMSTIVTEPPSSSFNSTTSTISSTSPKFPQLTSHISNAASKPSVTSDFQTAASPITLNNAFSLSAVQALGSGQTGIQEIAPSTQIPVQNSGTPVSTTTPIRATPGSSNIVSPGSGLSIQSASTVVSVPSRTSHESSTMGPVTSQTSSIISSSISVPLDVPSSSSSANTTRVLGTSDKGFLHKPGAMAGTFIAIGLFLIAGITFVILICRRRGTDHKYRRLMRGVVDENEIAGLTASASLGSQTNLSTTTGEYHTSNQSGSFRGLLEEMEEITPRPSLARSRSPLHPPNFSSSVPEAAMSSLVTLPTISNDEDSPVDPIDPFGPHRYSTAPDPFRTPRASVNPYLQNPDTEAAVKWMAANEAPVETEHLVHPTDNNNSVNILLEPYVREEVALPAKKTASMSWLEFSSEKTEL